MHKSLWFLIMLVVGVAIGSTAFATEERTTEEYYARNPQGHLVRVDCFFGICQDADDNYYDEDELTVREITETISDTQLSIEECISDCEMGFVRCYCDGCLEKYTDEQEKEKSDCALECSNKEIKCIEACRE